MTRLMAFTGAAFVLVLTVALSATVLHVPSEYATIQAGVDAAMEGDTVLVADGLYTGDGNRDIDFGGKAIVVMSENGPEKTIIDSEGAEPEPHRGFYFHSGEDSSSVVQGFTITGGWHDYGGGIYCYQGSSPTIVGNTVKENGGGRGAGISCVDGASPKIAGNTITGNESGWSGSGIYCRTDSHPMIERNRITANWGWEGAGIYCGSYSDPIIVGNTIRGNWGGWWWWGRGGGIYCFIYSSPTIVGNTISENWGGWHGNGGGISCQWTTATISGNTIVGNAADYGGGGIYCDRYGAVTVLNSILWADSAGIGEEVCVDSVWGVGSISVAYSDVEGDSAGVYVAPGCTLYWGEGNVDADPMFVLPEKGDYRLLWGSPCIDAGHPDSLDPDGTQRDIGAHFFDQDDYLTLYVTPDTTEILGGGQLGVTYTVINRWTGEETFWIVTEAVLPSGDTLGVLGPVSYTIPGESVAQVHVNHGVPALAPLGRYVYYSRIGVPPATLYDEDRFEFTVTAP